MKRIEWARWKCRFWRKSREIQKSETAEGSEDRGVPARYDRNRQSRAYIERRRSEVHLCGSNPLSTQDDVAASLSHTAKSPRTRSRARQQKLITSTSIRASTPNPTSRLDDGCDLVNVIHSNVARRSKTLSPAPKETTTASSDLNLCRKKACSNIRSSPSITPTRSIFSTTDTARARARSTG